MIVDEESRNWWRGMDWRVDPSPGEDDSDTATCPAPGGMWHRPREWCCHHKGTGDLCHKRIKPEDISSGMYACGVHMRHEIAAIKQAEAAAERKRQMEEAEALEAWEAEVYTAAFNELKMCFPELKSLDEHTIVRKGFRYRSVNKHVSVDVLELRDAVYALLTRARQEFSGEK